MGLFSSLSGFAISPFMGLAGGLSSGLGLGNPIEGLAEGLGLTPKQTGEQTVVQDLPEWQRPYVQQMLAQAQRLYGTNGRLTPNLDPNLVRGYQALAQSGGGLMSGLQDVLGGQYLDPATNPWLQKTYDAAASGLTRNFNTAVAPSIAAQMSASGRYGSGAHAAAMGNAADALGRNLASLSSDIYGSNYARERQNMMSALSMMPQAAALQSQGLLGLGQAQMGLQEQQLMEPWKRLGLLQGMITGNYGGSTTQPIYSAPGAMLLGAGTSLLGALGGARGIG